MTGIDTTLPPPLFDLDPHPWHTPAGRHTLTPDHIAAYNVQVPGGYCGAWTLEVEDLGLIGPVRRGDSGHEHLLELEHVCTRPGVHGGRHKCDVCEVTW